MFVIDRYKLEDVNFSRARRRCVRFAKFVSVIEIPKKVKGMGRESIPENEKRAADTIAELRGIA